MVIKNIYYSSRNKCKQIYRPKTFQNGRLWVKGIVMKYCVFLCAETIGIVFCYFEKIIIFDVTDFIYQKMKEAERMHFHQA